MPIQQMYIYTQHQLENNLCVVRQTYCNFGDRRFAVASPKLRQTSVNLRQFKRLLTC